MARINKDTIMLIVIAIAVIGVLAGLTYFVMAMPDTITGTLEITSYPSIGETTPSCQVWTLLNENNETIYLLIDNMPICICSPQVQHLSAFQEGQGTYVEITGTSAHLTNYNDSSIKYTAFNLRAIQEI